MKAFGVLLMAFGLLDCIYALAVSKDNFGAVSLKANWVQQIFGKLGVRVFYFLI